jgi:hypothetical protein
VRRSTLILYGLLAIAGAAATARADDHKARGDAATPAYTRADPVVSTSRGIHSILRPVTSGIRPSKGQAGHEQFTLTTPTTVAAAQSITRKFALEPSAIIIDVLVAYTKGAASHYSDIKRELIDVAIEAANNSFRLSNLGHIRLRIVHVYQTDYVEEGQHFDHVWRFAEGLEAYEAVRWPDGKPGREGLGFPSLRWAHKKRPPTCYAPGALE